MTNAQWIANELDEIMRLIDEGAIGCALDALCDVSREAQQRFNDCEKLLAVLDEALEHGEITGGMYRERTLEGEKIGDDTPMWHGPMVRNGACMSAKELAEELLVYGFRKPKTTDCLTCHCRECTDRGKPQNHRSRTAEECAADRLAWAFGEGEK